MFTDYKIRQRESKVKWLFLFCGINVFIFLFNVNALKAQNLLNQVQSLMSSGLATQLQGLSSQMQSGSLGASKSISSALSSKGASLPQTFDVMQDVSEVIEPSQYILGPGDKIEVTLMGVSVMNYQISITPTNDIPLPDLPPMHISNLTLSEAEKYIEKELSASLKKTKIKILLLSPRKIKVGIWIPGEGTLKYANMSYGTRVAEVVSSVAKSLEGASDTDSKSWYLAKQGKVSLRSILIKRGAKQEIKADAFLYYKLGDKSKNPYLQEGDIIYLTPRLKNILIAGYVREPGIYEFAEGDSLYTCIKLAGGLLETAFLDSIGIYRNPDLNNKKNELIYVSVKDSSKEANIPIVKNDIIFFGGKRESDERLVVSISGQIARPGVYSIEKGKTRLKDIIKQAGGVTEDALLIASEVIRKQEIKMYPVESNVSQGIRYDDNPESQYVTARQRMKAGILSVNLEKLFQGDETQNVLMMPGDEINIERRVNYVTVIGKVATPGKIEHIPKKKAEYYVERAGGFANRSRPFEILIQKPNSAELLSVDKVEISPGDVILIQEKVTPFIDDFTRILGIIGTISTFILSLIGLYNTIKTFTP